MAAYASSSFKPLELHRICLAPACEEPSLDALNTAQGVAYTRLKEVVRQLLDGVVAFQIK